MRLTTPPRGPASAAFSEAGPAVKPVDVERRDREGEPPFPGDAPGGSSGSSGQGAAGSGASGPGSSGPTTSAEDYDDLPF